MFVKCMSKVNCGNLRMRFSFQSTKRSYFVPKRVVVLCVHDIVSTFRTGMKF